jgi:hypothetical protein
MNAPDTSPAARDRNLAPDWPAARPVAASVEELLAGARRLGPYVPQDARSSARFERVEVDGEPCVVKYVHADNDFIMRVAGDIGCLPRRVWAAGLVDLAPSHIDHATLGAAPWGRNGWGSALLMRDVSTELVPVGDAPISFEQHLRFFDAIAALARPLWGTPADGASPAHLLPHGTRWSYFGAEQLRGEEQLGWIEPVPRIALDGWQRFVERVPADVADVVTSLARCPGPLAAALAATPQTFIHGDWKFGNLGVAGDGRVVLLDWTYSCVGPVCHELGWYLALNRARLPQGCTKESAMADFRAALERHGIDTAGWWDRQLGLCLLGALVQFGWEKALGEDDELGWWVAAARQGARWL